MAPWLCLLFALVLPCRALADTTQLLSNNPAGATTLLDEQRKHYLRARQALRQGHMVTFRKHRDRLHGYSLKIYLDYYELNRRLRRLPYQDVDTFLGRYADSHLGHKLRTRWLYQLGQHKQWRQFLNYYQPQTGNTRLQCLFLQARLEQGDAAALEEVETLWNVEHSQPNECTPLFKRWIREGGLTQEIAWERFNKAIETRNRGLAGYVLKQLEGDKKKLAELYLEVDRKPIRIRQHQRFLAQTEDMQNIILHGLNRYARRDPLTALYEWSRYDAQQLFDNRKRLQTQQQLIVQLMRKGYREAAQGLANQVPQLDNNKLTEILIRDALKQLDWAKVYAYLRQLPPAEQQSDRWLYWRARAMDILGIDDPAYPTPRQIYAQLALERSFYAFLAADILGSNYRLGDRPANPGNAEILYVSSLPASQRARELLAVGDTLNANREWLHMSTRFTRESQHIAAAKLAHRWGWHHKTITSLASARSWDDLQMRFPLAYNKHMFAAAQRHQVSPLLLFAIARQESAFAANARSPAGALGLMQLMPGTARQTARKVGVRYRKSDLLKPEHNIKLGSYYITELLQQFNNNRILATAAYNAGPHRVTRWLKETESNLPADVWVEVIPFRETRKYVQNVLAYSVIYGYRTGTTPEMLTPLEAKETL
jgi:soluble lytic murein transglycosylase